MKEIMLDILPTGLIAFMNLRDEATAWVGVICTVAVTAVTCLVNVYRLWRDRDNDLKKKDEEKEQEDNDK